MSWSNCGAAEADNGIQTWNRGIKTQSTIQESSESPEYENTEYERGSKEYKLLLGGTGESSNKNDSFIVRQRIQELRAFYGSSGDADAATETSETS